MPDSSFGGLHIADDVASADWIVASVRNFHHDVGSLLPVSFEAYARVLHPARRQSGIGEVDVPWSVVAHANGRIAHAAMEWVAITGDWKFMNDGVAGGQPGIWDRSPSTGRLPASQAASLASILARFTNAPLECRFAVWDGYADAPYQRGTVALIDMPNRPMVLLSGPLSAAGTAFSTAGWPESASLWWPDERAWCVASDIDLMSTYVAGSADCINTLLADGRLEVYAVSVDQTVHWRSDTLNPTPEP